MGDEIETLGGMSLGALFKRRADVDFTHKNCQNCGTVLKGKYCHVCSQLADDFHRPIWKLFSEALTDFLFLDGRVWRTIPRLLFVPGRVTREYVQGKRASLVPPFRLYLISSLIFFSLFFAVGPSNEEVDAIAETIKTESTLVEVLNEISLSARVQERAEQIQAETGSLPSEVVLSDGDDESTETLKVDVEIERGSLAANLVGVMADNAVTLLEEPRRAVLLLQSWLPRMMLICLPMMVLSLTVLYAFKKNVFVYDHIITSLHFISTLFLLTSFAMILPAGIAENIWFVLLFYVPIYLYLQLYRVYDSSWWLTAIRSFIICGLGVVIVSGLLLLTVGAVTASA